MRCVMNERNERRASGAGSGDALRFDDGLRGARNRANRFVGNRVAKSGGNRIRGEGGEFRQRIVGYGEQWKRSVFGAHAASLATRGAPPADGAERGSIPRCAPGYPSPPVGARRVASRIRASSSGVSTVAACPKCLL